jgi:hypothetical protein
LVFLHLKVLQLRAQGLSKAGAQRKRPHMMATAAAPIVGALAVLAFFATLFPVAVQGQLCSIEEGCFIPQEPSPSPCLPPFCETDPNRLISVELLTNMPPELRRRP